MNEWQRQKTIVTYLHPPKSERVITLRPEGKVMLGEVELNTDVTVPSYYEIVSSGIWPIYGKEAISADFKTAKFSVRNDGFPLHALTNECEGIKTTVEAFCDTDRKSTAFLKYTLQNTKNTKNLFGLMVRTGIECELVFDAPDVYQSYAPDISVWKNASANWKIQEKVLKNGEYFLKSLTEEGNFDEEKGILWFTLPAGETKNLSFIFGKDVEPTGNFEENHRKTLEYYKELSKRISLKEEMNSPLVRSQIFQMLQCFATPKNMELLLCRQGGLQRRMWPFEAMYVLAALDSIGNFDDFIEPVIDLYFSTMQIETGEVVPLGIYWALATAVCIHSFADHAKLKDKAYYEKYRERVMAGFDFIKRSRIPKDADKALIKGLFPPKQSCDAENVLQSWTLTDAHNVMGLKALAETSKMFADPRAAEIEAEYNDYRRVLMDCFAEIKKQSKNGEIRITNYLPGRGDEATHPFRAYAGTICSVLELPQDDVEKVIKALESDNSVHEGLYNRMPNHYRRKDADGKVREWYTTLDEFYWFETFARLGEWEKCLEIVSSTCKYAMTDEFYMTERFNERDPWFVPWSPNASASGRLILMLTKLQNQSTQFNEK